MRPNIYGIYKALRHFGVQGHEVIDIANGYKTWLKKPYEKKFGNPNFAYYIDGIFYAMPYPVRGYADKLVGVEQYHNIYLIGCVTNVRKDQIELASDGLKKLIFKKFPADEKLEAIKLKLPELCILKYLLHHTDYENTYLKRNMADFLDRIWVYEYSKNSDDGIAIANNGIIVNECPRNNSVATLIPVVLARSIDFVGRLNFYGVPDKRTAEKYRELYDAVKKKQTT